ncbi:POK11 protein, partial [Alaudala cheleensis]|nr:POK11 protein [Alaudala cheleensis]
VKDKIQQMPPWQYLGRHIRSQRAQPQQLQIQNKMFTLHEAQKLLGTTDWVKPLLPITNSDLTPLFALFKGESDLSSPRHLNHQVQLALQKVADAVAHRQASQWVPDFPFLLILLNPSQQPHALLFQTLITECIFLPHQLTKTIVTQHEMFAQLIIKAQQRLQMLAGCDFEQICIRITTVYLQWLLQMSGPFQIALADFSGQITLHSPPHKLFTSNFNIVLKPKRSETPLQALTVFTRGS